MKQITLPAFGIVLADAPDGIVVCADLFHRDAVHTDEQELYLAACEAILDAIAGHHKAGLDVTSTAYVEGVRLAVERTVRSHHPASWEVLEATRAYYAQTAPEKTFAGPTPWSPPHHHEQRQ